MSTTSSSDCDCEDYCHYSAGLYENHETNIYRTQMFPNFRQPLIYYAQIPQARRQRSRKGNPNCFVKAFRWYTQEHVPFNEDRRSTKPYLNEFASWLDNKYDEFIQSNPNDQNSYRLTLKQTSTLTAKKNQPNPWSKRQRPCSKDVPANEYTTCSCEVCSTKTKLKRLKSPWSKRQRPCSKDVPANENTTQSFHYILTPKDLSRRNSCCQSSMHSPSTETQKTQKLVIKSQSCTSFSREKSVAETIDIMTTQEGTNNNKTQSVKKPPKMSVLNNLACQCTIAHIDNVDVGTQYDKSIVETKNTFFKSVLSSVSKYERELRSAFCTNDVSCQCPIDEKGTPLRNTTSSKTNVKNALRIPKIGPKIRSSSQRAPENICDCPPEVEPNNPGVLPVPKPNENKVEKENEVCCSTNRDTGEQSIDKKQTSSSSKINSKTSLKSTSRDKLKSTSKDNFRSTNSENTLISNSKSARSCNICGACKLAPAPVTCSDVCPPEAPEIKTVSPPATVYQEITCKCPPKSTYESLPAIPVEPKSICHCPQTIETKTNCACTQYELQPCNCDIGKKCSGHVLQTTSQRKCSCEPLTRFDPTVENGAQTSDHCIIFDVNAPYTYPLFMKIVCADKLN